MPLVAVYNCYTDYMFSVGGATMSLQVLLSSTCHRLFVGRLPTPCLPSTCHRRPSTCHRLPSTCHRLPSAAHRLPSTSHRLLSTSHRFSSAAHRLSSVVSLPFPADNIASRRRRPQTALRQPLLAVHPPNTDRPASTAALITSGSPRLHSPCSKYRPSASMMALITSGPPRAGHADRAPAARSRRPGRPGCARPNRAGLCRGSCRTKAMGRDGLCRGSCRTKAMGRDGLCRGSCRTE